VSAGVDIDQNDVWQDVGGTKIVLNAIGRGVVLVAIA
jgi:hypothetical protein